jgi:hypothetical protein
VAFPLRIEICVWFGSPPVRPVTATLSTNSTYKADGLCGFARVRLNRQLTQRALRLKT